MQGSRATVGFVQATLALCLFAAQALGSASNLSEGAKWPSSKIRVAVSKSLENSPNVQGDLAAALERSFSLWSEVSDLRLEASPSDALSVSPKGIRGDGVSLITIAPTSENLKLFPRQQDSPAAVTRVFTDSRGRITEADIVLNPYLRFSTDGSFDTYDLQEIVSHEIGHLLGLGHSDILGSVMFERSPKSLGPASFSGSRSRLPSVDASAVRAIYGPKASDVSCCGGVTTKVGGIGRAIRTLAWVEDTFGRLMAAGSATPSGSVMIEGIPQGDYVLRVLAIYGNGSVANASSSVAISNFETTRAAVQLSPTGSGVGIELIGSHSYLGRAALRLDGNERDVTLGINGSIDQVGRVGLTGTERWFNGVSPAPYWQSQSVKVMQLDAGLFFGLPSGEYTLVLESVGGVRTFLPGAIVVRW